jgi:hypothetical protein
VAGAGLADSARRHKLARVGGAEAEILDAADGLGGIDGAGLAEFRLGPLTPERCLR